MSLSPSQVVSLDPKTAFLSLVLRSLSALETLNPKSQGGGGGADCSGCSCDCAGADCPGSKTKFGSHE